MSEVFSHVEYNRIPTRYSYQKLNLPHCKRNQGLGALPYIGPSLYNKLDKSFKGYLCQKTILCHEVTLDV